jgi:hypothetical protein
VLGTPVPLAEPLLVELINHAGWVPLWLPFITAMVGSAVALFGIFWSNRTNRKAIEAADRRARDDRKSAQDRDFRLWQRDTLLRLADEVVAAGIEAHNEYAKMIGVGSSLTSDDFMKSGGIIDAEGRKIAANIARLRLIGAHETANRAVALRSAINDRELLGAVIDVAQAPRKDVSAQLHGNADAFRAEMAARRQQRDELVEAINAARAAFGEAVERELALTNLQVFNQPSTPQRG